MSDLNALLAGIVAHPHEHVRWLILADWLDEHGLADRAELLRLHRMLIDTCCEPDAFPDRAAWQARIVELIDAGVKPCVPQHTLLLPGDVPLVGNFIPPGSFLMGGTESDDEKPVHRATLTRGYFLGASPVTQAQWRAVMGAEPSHFRGDDLPVEQVNWDDARAFCGRATELTGVTVRLPGEDEWEYACRAGTTTHFHWGDVPDAGRMNYHREMTWNGSEKGMSRGTTTAAGTFAVNPWGLSDCHGNVLEWCEDGFIEGYSGRTYRDDGNSYRVLRGGSWRSPPHACRTAFRCLCEMEVVINYFGFRIAFTLA